MFLRLKVFVGGYTLGFFLAGAVMVPFLEFLSRSATWQVRSEENLFILPPTGFFSFFLPDFFTKVAWPFDMSGCHSLSLYAGISPLILGILALALKPQKIALYFGGFSLFVLAIVFGLPPFFPLLTLLPLFKQAPNFYMVPLYVLSLSLLGGIGMDRLVSEARDQALEKRVILFFMGAGFVILFLAAGFILLVKEAPFLAPLYKGLEGLSAPALGLILSQVGKSLARSAFLAGSTLVLILGIFWTRRFRGTWKIGLVGVTFIDLFVAGFGWNPAVPIPWVNPPAPPSIQFLNRDKDLYRIAGFGPVMMPNLATLCGLQDIRGYDVPVDRHYHTFFQKALKGNTAWWSYELQRLEPEAMPFLSLLNVKYLVSLDPLPSPLRLIYDKEVKVYENPGVFPRAFLVHQADTVRDESEALERVMALGPELQHMAVLEGPLPESLSKLNESVKSPRIVTPVETGVQNSLKQLDSGFRRNDGNRTKETSRENIKLDSRRREAAAADRVQVTVYRARQVEVEVETLSPGLLVLVLWLINSVTYFQAAIFSLCS